MNALNTTKLLILFGSRATGRAKASSDADVAVLADHQLTLAEKAAIGEKAAQIIGMSEDIIDIIDLWTASPLLQFAISQEGKLLYGDNADFIRFKVLAWKRYLDTAKFRRMRKKSLAAKYGK